MAIEIKMPRLSDTMEAGTLVKWYVKEGEKVESGKVLADVETDKATMEMPTYDAGTVAKIIGQVGKKVHVGETLMILAEEGESVKDAIASVSTSAGASSVSSVSLSPAAPPDSRAAQAGSSSYSSSPSPTAPVGKGTAAGTPAPSPAPSSAAPPAGVASTPTAGGNNGNGHSAGYGRMLISPLARRLADEHHLDLRTIQGSGPQGRIIKRDVLAVIEDPSSVVASAATAAAGAVVPTSPVATAAAPVTPLGSTVALSSMRQTIARRLVESKSTIPHYQVCVNINVDPLLDLRRTLNTQLAAQGVKLSVNDFLVRACALCIHQHTMFNAVWNNDALILNPRVNVGIAISLSEERGGGLVVATMYDADRKGLRQISTETKALADKARTRGLTVDEMSNATFTISNLGMYGVDFFTAIINPPNAAILAVGAALEKAVVRNGQLAVGHEMSCTLSLDHRIIDGATGARFLQTLKQMVENPATLLV